MSPLEQHGITNFELYELVHPYVYNKYGESRIIQWLDLRVFKAIQWIRTTRGNPILINTWHTNATIPGYPRFDDRGLRWHGVSDTGKKTSQHYFGRAGDIDEPGTPAEELYNWCLQNQDKLLELGVTTIESINYTKTWVHLDCRNYGQVFDRLIIVSP